MSAIVGLYGPMGRPIDPGEVCRMLTVLAHRGPDGVHLWAEGPVGLGHRMLWTTPESLQEEIPLVSPNGMYVLTADVRVDNREELCASLGFAGRLSRQIPDSQLILAAYAKWGIRCPEKLLGDFAFAIWDGPAQRLFCARDHFGVKPFYYYYQPRSIFAFASEIKALLSLPEIPRRLNDVRIADYLASVWTENVSTFYRQILRLPPAHSLIVSRQGIRVQSYWQLDPTRELPCVSDTEYADTFRGLFTQAVQCRLRSGFPVGTHLSGGLDSSAVTCVARNLLGQTNRLPLHTFSNVFEHVSQCDERPFRQFVLAQGGLIAHDVHADRYGPFVDLERVFWHHDEPFYGPNHGLVWGLHRAIAPTGVRIVLDGFDGDTTVSHGATYFAELARQGRWETFASEAQAVAQHFATSPWSLLQCYGFPYLQELVQAGQWLTLCAQFRQLRQYFPVSRRLLWWQGAQGLWNRQYRHGVLTPEVEAIIHPDFVRKTRLSERLQAMQGLQGTPPRTVREEQWRSFYSGLFSIMLEQLDRCAAAFALEICHPFMDKRLIEFCLALPPTQKLQQGWSRMVMRRALTGILPEPIQWRGGKTDMTPNFLYGLLNVDRELLDEVMLRNTSSIAPYVNTPALRQIYQRTISQDRVRVEDAMTVWRVATLAHWLSYTKLMP